MSTILSDDDVVTQNTMSVYTVVLCVPQSYCDDMKNMREKCAIIVVQCENINGKFGVQVKMVMILSQNVKNSSLFIRLSNRQSSSYKFFLASS